MSTLNDDSGGVNGPGNLKSRFLLVEALRGFAAMSVVLFHVWRQNLESILHQTLPEPFETLIRRGNLGVPIFFVLSGFVIAHSTYQRTITGAYFRNFVLRRSIRLDLPYWSSIVLALGTLLLAAKLRRDEQNALPSVGEIAAQFVYLQELLHIPGLLGVYWTLCYEVQFYLAFVLLQWLAQRLTGSPTPARISPVWIALFAVTWVISALSLLEVVPIPRGIFFRYWLQFFIGVCAYWAYRDFIPRSAFIVLLIATWLSAPTHPAYITVAIVAGLLYVAGRNGWLFTISGGRTFQWLGRISYSLYLTHQLTGVRVARYVAERYPTMGLGQAVVLIIVAVLLSLACAQLFYWAVERPSIGLAHRVRLPEAQRSDTQSADAQSAKAQSNDRTAPDARRSEVAALSLQKPENV